MAERAAGRSPRPPGPRGSRREGPARRCALPEALRPLFWDHDFPRLRWDRDGDLILARVLAEGGLHHVRILRSRLGDAAIRDWILRHRGRGLSPERIRFWELVLKLPPGTANAWVRAAQRGTWGNRRRG